MAGSTPTLERLVDTPFALAEGETDIRNRPMLSAAGEELGTIEALFVDTEERKVRLVQLASGGVLGLGKRQALVPVEAIRSIDAAGVHLGHDVEHVVGAPRYDPDLVDAGPYLEELYGWYGSHPYWGPLQPGTQGPPARFRNASPRGPEPTARTGGR